MIFHFYIKNHPFGGYARIEKTLTLSSENSVGFIEMRHLRDIKNILLPLACTLIFTVAKAQSSEISRMTRECDSLKTVLAVQSLTDIEQMKIYARITECYASFDPDSVIVYAPKVIALAEKLGDQATVHYNCCHLGTAYCFKCKYDTSLFYLEKAHRLAVAMNNKYAQSRSLGLLAYRLSHQGKYISAIEMYLQALAIEEKMNHTINQIHSLAALGEMNRKLGNTGVALKYLDEAAGLCHRLRGFGYSWRLTKIYNEYATVHLENGEIEKAFDYASKAEAMDGGVINNCITKTLMSKICLRLGDSERALHYADEAMTQANILKSDKLNIEVLNILSEIYLAQQRYREAETEALKIWRVDSTNISESRIAAANIALANIYMQNIDKAAYFFGKSSELNDRYSEKSFQTTVSDLSIKYEIEKKELRILSLKRQRLIFATISVGGMLLSIAALAFLKLHMHRGQTKKALIAAHAVVEGTNDERERATGELNGGLVEMIAATKAEAASVSGCPPKFGDKLDECISEIYRVIAGIRPVLLSRFGIKAALEDYCSRFPNVQFCFVGEAKHIDEETEDAVYYCACELVNNSIKHSDATLISVRLTQDDKHIVLNVRDNGRGFDAEKIVEGSGMKNISYRALAFDGVVAVVTSPDAGTETNIDFKIKTS
jgi:tetratricopeptide (TPR) repeat protein